MGLTTPSRKTTIVEKPNENSRPDPKIRRPKLWKRKHDLTMGIKRWRLIAKDRTEWAGIVREAKALQGP
jgi:hypothetical protein